jgi:hypothetical protein
LLRIIMKADRPNKSPSIHRTLYLPTTWNWIPPEENAESETIGKRAIR